MTDKATIDTTGAQELLEQLKPEHAKGAIKSVLKKQANKLLKATRANFMHLEGIKGDRAKRSLTGMGKDKVGGITVYADKTTNPFAVVSLRGRRTDFRALFFERGTKERYTKGKKDLFGFRGTGAYRGRIEGGHYFERAQQQTESSIFREMEADLIQIINRKVKSYSK